MPKKVDRNKEFAVRERSIMVDEPLGPPSPAIVETLELLKQLDRSDREDDPNTAEYCHDALMELAKENADVLKCLIGEFKEWDDIGYEIARVLAEFGPGAAGAIPTAINHLDGHDSPVVTLIVNAGADKPDHVCDLLEKLLLGATSKSHFCFVPQPLTFQARKEPALWEFENRVWCHLWPSDTCERVTERMKLS